MMESSSSGSKALPGAQDGAASMLVNRIIDLFDNFNNYGYAANLSDSTLLSKICITLARGIDHAIANNEVPLRSRKLPQLLYKVLLFAKDVTLQKTIQHLMEHINGARDLNWFSDQDTETLYWFTERLFNYFSATTLIRSSQSFPSSMEVMSRFHPKMKMDKMLVSLELQPGTGRYETHFHIIRGMVDQKQDKIWLFVDQIDKIDSSACTIALPEVNFLLNEKVVGRNLGSVDKAPQLPTNVTCMMKYGVNILQVVGKFHGKSLVIVASMHTVPCSDAQELQNYVSPAALNNSEAAIIETPPTISLNCPISEYQVKTPVKGQLCEHPEVLMKAEEKVTDVNLSLDGSWEKIKDHSAGRDAPLHEHKESGSALGNSIPHQAISLNLNSPVDSYMNLLITDTDTSLALDPADDREQVTISPEENKSSPSRNKSTGGGKKFPAFDLNAYPDSDTD